MKLVKFSVFALALGLFAASCNETTTPAETPDVNVDVAPTAPVVVDPAMQAPADTNMKPAAEMPKADMPN